jgi:hypothetical protein
MKSSLPVPILDRKDRFGSGECASVSPPSAPDTAGSDLVTIRQEG